VLSAQLAAIASGSGARVSIVVLDLHPGSSPTARVQLNPTGTFNAASTYKLPLLMANAENIAKGVSKTTDRICFKSSEQEDGWFDDYDSGDCFSRQTLATRAGRYSDNTAGHMLIDNLGGGDDLNAYASSRGATDSSFFVPNSTTAADLAALMATEANGGAGGQAAQTWLYPLLTNTIFENGLPAGVPGGVTVVHKVGAVDATVNDVGLVMAPKGSYVIAVMTDGVGGDDAYALIAQISAAVWASENS
jgi:beta-lactamase class A